MPIYKFLGVVVIIGLTALPVHSFANQDAKSAYLNGNYEKAIKLWQNSAENGDADAQFNLGFMAENGQGMKRDLFAAAQWYELAARQNYPTAEQMLLAVQKRISKENEEAMLQWLPQAEAGDAQSQLAVSKILSLGQLAVQDNIEALKWLTLAKEGTKNDTVLRRIQRFEKQLLSRLNTEQIAEAAQRVTDWKALRKTID